ncbi:MAG: penicillin acylase family protein [Acetobacteraceae bacterium]|nr:penicillin acylase family protein [Acetobacteraceae bacterium]
MAVRTRRSRRWLRRALVGLAAVPLLAAVAVSGLLWWSLPSPRATPRIPGLSAPVEVALDRHGIPRVDAATERDAAAALGWLHARDRMFPMEMMRRGASGRLAELAGPAMLMNDRFVRTLGLLRRAEADLAILPAETRAVLEAYAAGVNAWIAERGRFAAPEFVPLGAPEPWRPEHSLLWGKVMGLWLSGNWRQELEHARLAATLPPERLSDLWPADDSPGRPDALPEPVTAGGEAPRKNARTSPSNASATSTSALAAPDVAHLSRLLDALPRFPDSGTLPDSASNAWAVSGARSASGAPLLASDPHLGFNAPVLWYLARIDLGDGRMMAGATSPGVPGIVIGRTHDLAWGFTTTHSDTQDVFVETPAGTDGYETPDGPRPFAVREETIAVRGGAPVRLRIRETRHGPVVSDLDPEGADGRVLAVSMANLAPGDISAAGLLALNSARTVEEGKAAAALITGTPQNLMMADRAGGIAMALTGRTPVRRSGDGTLPAPGADGSHDWTGWAPFEALPHAQDPPGGALANANNRVSPPGHPVYLGRDWFGDWRFRRIGEMLASRARHDAPGFAAMQRDTASLLARELAAAPDAVLRKAPRPEGAAGAAYDLLLAWDGNIAADRPEPLVFNAWMRAARRLALENGGAPPGAGGPEFLRHVLSPDGHGAAPWCGGDCAALAGRALRDAVAGLQATEGPDPSAWRWGRVHVARFEHPILRFVPIIGRWTRLEAPTGGDEETVGRGGMRGAGPASWRHVHGAGLRLVADLADPDRTLAVIATGQSAHPLSRHWGDLLPAWRDGGTVLLGRVPADGREGGRFRLLPP